MTCAKFAENTNQKRLSGLVTMGTPEGDRKASGSKCLLINERFGKGDSVNYEILLGAHIKWYQKIYLNVYEFLVKHFLGKFTWWVIKHRNLY